MKQVGLPANGETRKIVQNHFHDIQLTEKFMEILFLSASRTNKLNSILSQETGIENDAFVLINDIYANKHNSKAWQNIKMHEKVTVTVDMFHCGAVFFRKEQAKEHFKIRI